MAVVVGRRYVRRNGKSFRRVRQNEDHQLGDLDSLEAGSSSDEEHEQDASAIRESSIDPRHADLGLDIQDDDLVDGDMQDQLSSTKSVKHDGEKYVAVSVKDDDDLDMEVCSSGHRLSAGSRSF